MHPVIFFLGLLVAVPVSAQEVELAPGETLLQLSATGTADVKPDIATISAGITTTGKSAREAIDANSRVAAEIVSAMTRQGVAERDIRTQTINVSPQFAQPQTYQPIPSRRSDPNVEMDEGPRITGYIANNQVEVRIRDLDVAPELVDDLFEAGANNVYGPNFSLEDQAPAMRAARLDAVRNLQAQAAEYAAAFGKRIVRLTAVSDRGGSSGPVYRQVSGIVATGGGYPAAPPPPPPAPMQPGELQVQASVWGDYILAD